MQVSLIENPAILLNHRAYCKSDRDISTIDEY